MNTKIKIDGTATKIIANTTATTDPEEQQEQEQINSEPLVTTTVLTNQQISTTATTTTATITTTTATTLITACSSPPPILFLCLTLFFTIISTALLCIAINTDHWERVSWNQSTLMEMTNHTNQTLRFYLNERVAKLNMRVKKSDEVIFFVPMHGGIWTLCIDLNEQDMKHLGHIGFPYTIKCINYLADNMINSNFEEMNDLESKYIEIAIHPHLRMQNLSISCSLVCLIILGSAALVGAFGVCQKQISAILVTGVMYLLAALFALFTLMIIHLKRQQGRVIIDSNFYGTIDGIIATKRSIHAAQHLLVARHFTTSWSLDLGWCGVALCYITSILWIFLSKILRYNSISTLLL